MYHLDSIINRINEGYLQTYTYSYPHKSAYRELKKPIDLTELWSKERRSHLMMYLHIPFCEMKCGFCNLFSTVDNHSQDEILYLKAIERQFNAYRDILGDYSFARSAIGGGTPTILSDKGLECLLSLCETFLFGDFKNIPCSVETSPKTASSRKMQLLNDAGVSRISIGVQSIYEQENSILMRHQPFDELRQALDNIKKNNFECLNCDLIYGIPGQTYDTLRESLNCIMDWDPEEIYLYPLYQRPGTGMWSRNYNKKRGEEHLKFYDIGRDLLLSKGYVQISTRLFRKDSYEIKVQPQYSCQDDGMVGIGCGARSYTDTYHYSHRYSVNRKEIKTILGNFYELGIDDFKYSYYGVHLDEEDRRRRFIIKSLLHGEGLSQDEYKSKFSTDIHEDFPDLFQVVTERLATNHSDRIVLTEKGMKYGDIIGPWLMSNSIKDKVHSYIAKI